MLQEFKAFIARGNVMELAVAVIIAGAFATIVASMTDDLIMPLAFIIFMLVRYTKKVTERYVDQPDTADVGPTETELLIEIRDELRKRPQI